MNGGGYNNQQPQMRHGGRQNQYVNQHEHYAYGNNQARNNYNNLMNGNINNHCEVYASLNDLP